MSKIPPAWLALMVGNSRLHWARFVGTSLQQTWNTPHLSPEQITALTQHQLDFAACFGQNTAAPALDWTRIPSHLPLWFASVVPAQIPLWQQYEDAHQITLEQIPIAGLYPTMGIDRTLALLGAITVYGQPSLVIDAGTALTLTGANAAGELVGGAILPGLQLQLRALAEHTAALPYLVSAPDLPLPTRWTTNTPDAIWSGVLYTLLAGLQDFVEAWQQQFPGSTIVLTGGDAAVLVNLLQQYSAKTAQQVRVDAELIVWGMRQVVQR